MIKKGAGGGEVDYDPWMRSNARPTGEASEEQNSGCPVVELSGSGMMIWFKHEALITTSADTPRFRKRGLAADMQERCVDSVEKCDEKSDQRGGIDMA